MTRQRPISGIRAPLVPDTSTHRPRLHGGGSTALPILLALFVLALVPPPSGIVYAQESHGTRFFLVLSSPADVVRMDGRVVPASSTLRSMLDARGASVLPLVSGAASMRKGSTDLDRYLLIRVPPGVDAAALMSACAADPAVEYVQREGTYRLDAVPNDSAWSGQWGTQRVQAVRAWDRTRGDARVVVGVIDTGIDHEHPDLSGQLWINAAEDRNGNGRYDPWPVDVIRNGVAGDFDGIDNDGNGYIDDVTGYDFVDQRGAENAAGGDYTDPDPDITDDMGHGTSVSGIIAAAADNGIGIAGTAPGCRLMTLRAFDARGVGQEGDVARALAYAVASGASVINMSFGDVQYSRVLRDMIRYAYARGVVMVASAGNAQSDALHYPSAYDETISVSASTQGDGLAGFSNYGATIDLAAPGVDIVTTERGGRYGSFNGTSASAPFVSAAAALIRSLLPSATPEDVKGMLLASAVDRGTTGWDNRFGAGVLDIARALDLEAPTVVRITAPRTDQGLRDDRVVITGTVASPIMNGYRVHVGTGVNPSRWTEIQALTPRQVVLDTLAIWDASSFPDSTYTIRLSAVSAKGITIEDRVVITIDRAPPLFLGIGFIPALDGRSYGLAAGFITDEPTLGRVWYRRKGSGEEWKWVSAESGSTNNLFVTRTHATWLGEDVLVPGSTWELYYTAEDAVGLESRINNRGTNFEYTAPLPVSELGIRNKPYGVPVSRIFPITPDFTGDGRPELLYNDYTDDGMLRIVQHDGVGFSPVSGVALGNHFPRGIGDITGDGRPELLASFVRHGFVYVSDAPGTVPSRLAWADTSGAFWPMGMVDLDRDGRQEVLAVINDSTVGIFAGDAQARLARIGTIVNPTAGPLLGRTGGVEIRGTNSFSAARFAAGDFNGNGRVDLLFGDADGDFFIVEYEGNGRTRTIWIAENEYSDGSDFVAAGDIDGDGRDEFVLGVRTVPDDVIPFWSFGVYRLNAQNIVSEVWSQRFHGVGESGQYGSFTRISNSLTAANLDGDPELELVISVFPELYIFDYDRSARTLLPIHVSPLVNTTGVAVADFDGNGIPECVAALPDTTVVFERDLPELAPPPVRFLTTEYVSPRQIRVSWGAANPAPAYRVYKGPDRARLLPFGTVPFTSLSDFDISAGDTIVYAVTAVDSSRTPPESPPIYSRTHRPHGQPVVDSVSFIGQAQVRVHVNRDLGTVIPSSSLFTLNETRLPESVALLDQRSLLLSFGTLSPGPYGLRVRGLHDGEGIPFLANDVFPVLVTADTAPACFIEQVTFAPPRGFIVRFSGPVDPVTASIPASYRITLLGAAVRAEPDPQDPRLVRITFGDGAPIGATGREYVLTVDGVRCADGSVIGDGPGSSAGIVLNRQTLDDVFVFPNPWHPSDGVPVLTFANLTPRAVIRIYTLSGLFIREVSETDGNGGTEWDLRDDAGRPVPAGVYLFYATGTDSNGKEVTPKTGKLAIVR